MVLSKEDNSERNYSPNMSYNNYNYSYNYSDNFNPYHFNSNNYKFDTNYYHFNNDYINHQLFTTNYNSKINTFNINKYQYLDNYVTNYYLHNLTTDGLYYLFDSRKKVEFNNEYFKNSTFGMIKSYLKSKSFNYLIKKGGSLISSSVIKKVKIPLDFSSCMVDETNFMSSHNIVSSYNLLIGGTKCGISTGFNSISTELSLINSISANAFITSVDIAMEKMYNMIPKDYNSNNNFENFVTFLYNYKALPILQDIANVNQSINTVTNYVFDNGEILLNKGLDFISSKWTDLNYKYIDTSISVSNIDNFAYDNIITPYENGMTFEIESVMTSDMGSNMNMDNSMEMGSNMEMGNTNNSNLSNIQDFDLELTSTINDVDINTTNMEIANDNIQNEPTNLELLNQNLADLGSKLQTVSTFVNVLNIIKNFNEMDPLNFLMEIECLLINLKTDDRLINGIFQFIKNASYQGEITLDNIIDLGIALAEKCLNLPLSNAYHLIKDLMDGKSINEYLKPLLMDLATIVVPQLFIIRLINNIFVGIKELFTSRSIRKVDGIDCLCTDEIKIGFFNIKHKITYENDFFGIHITYTTSSSNNGRRICEEEFKRQLDYKVYQVIGIPIEFINNSIDKPTTRYDNYQQRYYLNDLENYWLEINNKYLTEQEKECIRNMYFENENDKEYRYQLAKNGEAPSWYWKHKKDDIITFSKNVYLEIKKLYKSNPKINSVYSFTEFFKLVFHSLFDNKKISKNKDLEKTESKNQTDYFTSAKNKRRGTDNKKLTEYRNNQRIKYNDSSDEYSRNAIISRARLELFYQQVSVEYFLESGYSSFIGYLGSIFSYIDYEIIRIKEEKGGYLLTTLSNYTGMVVQGYFIRVLSEQAITYCSLLQIMENVSDEILSDYINPLISSLTGLTVGIIKCTLSSDDNKYNNIVINAGMTAVNSCFGFIYTYLKNNKYLSYFNGAYWDKSTVIITNGIKYLFRLGLSVEFVSAVLSSFLLNFGMRCLTGMYNNLTYESSNNLEYLDMELSIYQNVYEIDTFLLDNDNKVSQITEMEKPSEIINDFEDTNETTYVNDLELSQNTKYINNMDNNIHYQDIENDSTTDYIQSSGYQLNNYTLSSCQLESNPLHNYNLTGYQLNTYQLGY